MAQESKGTGGSGGTGLGTVTLDQLVTATSTSVLRALKEQESGGRFYHPRIWFGIWIDIDRLPGQGGPLGGPGGGGPGGGREG